MAKKKIGNQKPTCSFFRPYKKSLYKEVQTCYERSGREVFPWQINLLKPLMAVNSEGLFTHTKFGYAIPRRNGKNEIVVMRELYALEKGQKVLHTAHRTMTSHSAWERLKDVVEKCDYQEGEDYTSQKAVGRERIDFPATGGRVEFRTRTSTGGLGEGFDLLVIDEAQEYTEDQESALKYVVTDSENPQTIFCGTPPTPISAGTVFSAFRTKVLDGAVPNGGWAEWSVEKISDVRDKSIWYQSNPSLGLIFTERSVEDEIGTDETDFNIQRLGLWLKYNQKSAIKKQDWEALRISRLPILLGKLFVGIKFGNDGLNVALSIAVKTLRADIFIESIDCQSVRNGSEWILDFLSKADIEKVVIDGAGAQSLLAQEIKGRHIPAKIIFPTVKEVIKANAAWERAIYAGTVKHMGQPSLFEVVTNCEKRNIGSNGGFGYKSQLEDFDIALMDSALLAHWACSEHKPTKQQIHY